MFFFTVIYDSEYEVNVVMTVNGILFFKAMDILNILGYKKPALAVKNHVPDAVSLDVLMAQNDSVMDTRIVPFPRNSKVLSSEQVSTLLHKIQRPSEQVNRWFRDILHKPLKCNEELDVLQRVNYNHRCVKPRFQLDPEGLWFLMNLKTRLESRFNVKEEIVDESDMEVDEATQRILESVEQKLMVSTGVNTDISNPNMVHFQGPEQSVIDAREKTIEIFAENFDENNVPRAIRFRTETGEYRFEKL